MTCCTVNKFVSVRLFFALYVVDAHQDFYMRIAMRISAYADHPHEPHGSATAWPSLDGMRENAAVMSNGCGNGWNTDEHFPLSTVAY